MIIVASLLVISFSRLARFARSPTHSNSLLLLIFFHLVSCTLFCTTLLTHAREFSGLLLMKRVSYKNDNSTLRFYTN